jgi:hypothetical protein
MSSNALRTYLNDHLAGSVAALELLDHLTDLHSDPDRKRFFTGLRAEVEEDQNVLQQLREKIGGKEGTARKAAAWLTEKFGQGKLALWRPLAVVADRIARLQGVDFARLEQRAIQQHERVETQRLQAARVALTGKP